MRGILTIKPIAKVAGSGKQDVLERLGVTRHSWCSTGNGFGHMDNDHMYLYTLQKFRRKTKVVISPRKGNFRDLVRKAHWTGCLYRIPRNIIFHAEQMPRRFTLHLKIAGSIVHLRTKKSMSKTDVI